MQHNPFSVPTQYHRELDFCFYKLCWDATPADITAQYPALARHIDLAAVTAYLAAERPATEYISAFFPRDRAESLCRYKMHHGWTDPRIAAGFPKTAALADLPDLRAKTLDLYRSHIRYLSALKAHCTDHAVLDRQISATSRIGKIIAANA